MSLYDLPPEIPDEKPLCEPLLKVKRTMPPVFAGRSLDEMTGQGYRWRTLQNEKSRGEAPADIFLRQGKRKLLVDRDKFLAYWQSKIS
jgi:hypothetical protein